jgi:hypothetical protein
MRSSNSTHLIRDFHFAFPYGAIVHPTASTGASFLEFLIPRRHRETREGHPSLARQTKTGSQSAMTRASSYRVVMIATY